MLISKYGTAMKRNGCGQYSSFTNHIDVMLNKEISYRLYILGFWVHEVQKWIKLMYNTGQNGI